MLSFKPTFSLSSFTFIRMWSNGEGNGKPLQYSYLENPMNSMKRSLYTNTILNLGYRVLNEVEKIALLLYRQKVPQ